MLPTLIHPYQYGFLHGRNILHNILNVQIGVDYAKAKKQEIVMVQLDLEKAFDHVNWSFLSQLMTTMGFGPKMANLVHLLGSGSITWIMLNRGTSNGISVTRSLR